MELVELDGSFGEGGGQVLRNSTSLAAILGVGISIENIRFKRPKPGLRPQHLMGVRAAVDISGAASQGVKVAPCLLFASVSCAGMCSVKICLHWALIFG